MPRIKTASSTITKREIAVRNSGNKKNAAHENTLKLTQALKGVIDINQPPQWLLTKEKRSMSAKLPDERARKSSWTEIGTDKKLPSVLEGNETAVWPSGVLRLNGALSTIYPVPFCR